MSNVINLLDHPKFIERRPVEISVAGIILTEGPMMSDEEIREIFALFQTPTDPQVPK